MKWHRAATIIVYVSLMMTVCSSGDRPGKGPQERPETDIPVEVVRGFAVYGHEVRAFRPCDAAKEVWAIDRSGLLWELHKELALGRSPYEEVFTVVEGRFGPSPDSGFGAEYQRALEVTRVLYMAREGFSCDLDLSAFRYRAFGNEPFWFVSVSLDTILLKMPGYEDRRWTIAEEQPSEGGVVFVGAGPPGPVRVDIVEAPCRDNMSGAYSAYTARMRLGDEAFEGCAIRGTARPDNRR